MRIAIIGGSGKMGFATAEIAVRAGAEVVLFGRTQESLDLRTEILGKLATAVSADCAIFEQCRDALTKFAPFNHIVVAIAASARAGHIVKTAPSIAQSAFDRFWTAYHAVHLAPLVLCESGSITLISGSSGRRPVLGYGVWGALHGSIEALARSAAIDLAPIRVNVVSPGGIGMKPDRQLVHHAGTPENVAAMIWSMISNPAITGAVVDVDGGERLGSWPSDEPVR